MRFVSQPRNFERACLKSAAAFVFAMACTVAILALAVVRSTRTVEADDWLPISQDELKMTSVPEAPGAPAVILYRQVDRDDSAKTGNEQNYVRIKILTEEGRKYADVEIPYFREQGNIVALRARTIRPDGSIAMFEGKAYDKTIVKARNVKYLAKTFTLPDVQVGSIIEYRYTEDMVENYVYNSHWILSDELFTKQAKFSLRPNKDFALRWSWPIGLPPGVQPPKQEPSTKLVRMEANNIPAFQIEDYMPPANELKYRVTFEYSETYCGERSRQVLETAREDTEFAGREFPGQEEGTGTSGVADGVAERCAGSEGAENLCARAAAAKHIVRGGKDGPRAEAGTGEGDQDRGGSFAREAVAMAGTSRGCISVWCAQRGSRRIRCGCRAGTNIFSMRRR